MRSLLRSFVGLLTAALILVLAGTAQAATFTVTNTLDEPDALQGDSVCATDPSGPAAGACTLRAAVQESNAIPLVADTITLPANTFTLTRTGTEATDPDAVGDLDLLSDITIDGSSSGPTIVQAGTGAADPIDRVFEVSGAGTNAAINVMTIRNGLAGDGGAVRNDASLSLSKVTITDGEATGDGGGIFNGDTGATLDVVNSTISGNSANQGGGLASSSTNGSVTNVTIANNSATSGGGGIFGSPPSLKSTIVANNTTQNCSGSVSSGGHNIASDNSCGLSGTGDLSSTDPKLGALADNGGPTFTHALLATSPAIDKVPQSVCPPPNTDQRNVNRPQNGDQLGDALCDTGAYEAEPGADLLLEKTDDPDPVHADDNLTYTLKVTNQAGINSATNVTVTDTLPTSVTFVSASPGCTHSAGTVTCDLGAIAPGANKSVEIVVTPTRVQQISDTATVSSDAPDPNTADNSDTETTDVKMSLDPIPSPTSDKTPTYSGKAAPAGGLVTVTIKDSADQTVQQRTATPNPVTGAYSVEGFPDLPDGDYTAQASQGSDSSQSRSFTIDTEAPQVTLDPVPSPSNDNTPTFSGTADPDNGDVTVTVKDSGGQTVQTRTATPDSGGNYSVDASPPLADGDYTAQASQTDQAGNTSTSEVRSFTIDTQGPDVTLDEIPSPSGDTTPTFSGTADPNSGDVTVTVKDDQDQVVQTRTATPDGNGDYSVDASPPLDDGDYTAQASQTDELGNTGTSEVRSFTIDTELSPNSVQVNKGKQVGGNASSLEEDDGNFFSVKTKSDSKKVSWSANFNGVPNSLSDFELVYRGLNSKSCTQKLKVFNFSSGTFVTANTSQVGNSEQQITVDDDTLPGNPGDYVSGTSGNGTFSVQVVCTNAKKNTSSGDLMQLTFDV